MGRVALVCTVAALLLYGCATPRPSPQARAAARWSHVCAALRADACGRNSVRDDMGAELSQDARGALDSAATNARRAVVEIRTRLKTPEPRRGLPTGAVRTAARSGGTGVVIESDGIILTNEHVLHDAATVEVVYADGRSCRVSALAVDATRDLAVLRVEDRALTALAVHDRAVAAGAPVIALAAVTASGCDRACYGIVLARTVSLQLELDPASERDYGELIESTTALEPGFSGGPLLDGAGRIVGLNVAAVTRADGVRRGYALPLDEATCQAIAQLVATARQR